MSYKIREIAEANAVDFIGLRDLTLAADRIEELIRAALRGIESKPTEQGWVSVTERLPVSPDSPSSAARVLVWTVKDDMGWIAIRFYRRPEWNKTHPEWWSGGDAVDGETITHWMPLPAAPSAAGRESEGRLKDAGPESNVPPPAPLSDLSSAVREAAAKLAECADPHDGRDHAECPFCSIAREIRALPLPPMSADVQEAVELARWWVETFDLGRKQYPERMKDQSAQEKIARALLKLTSAQRGD